MFNDMNFQDIGYLIKFTCPVDLIVKDPDGLIIGKDINEIPDAYYCELDLILNNIE